MSGDFGTEGALPASGSKVVPALAQALSHLKELAAKRDFEHEGWPDHAKLWKEMLQQSRDKLSLQARGRDLVVAPNILKGDLASPTGIKLDGRRWRAFEKWFERNIAPELVRLAQSSGVPALRIVRRCDVKGGYPENSEAMYYLAFLEEQMDVTRWPENGSAHGKGNGQLIQNSGAEQFRQRVLSNETEYSGGQRNSFMSTLIGYRMKYGVQEQQEVSRSRGVMPRCWRAGISIVLSSIFVSQLGMYIPAGPGRWGLLGFSIVLFLVGSWRVYQAVRRLTR